MLKRLRCRLFGHKYGVVIHFSADQRMVACARCRNRWAMHDGLRAIMPWDSDFTRLYTAPEAPCPK